MTIDKSTLTEALLQSFLENIEHPDSSKWKLPVLYAKMGKDAPMDFTIGYGLNETDDSILPLFSCYPQVSIGPNWYDDPENTRALIRNMAGNLAEGLQYLIKDYIGAMCQFKAVMEDMEYLAGKELFIAFPVGAPMQAMPQHGKN